jgi:hypothetical protein
MNLPNCGKSERGFEEGTMSWNRMFDSRAGIGGYGKTGPVFVSESGRDEDWERKGP